MELSFCSQNVNSLSLSQTGLENFKRKLTSVLSFNFDVVFLQDLRANTDVKPDNIQKINYFLLNNGFADYDLLINSNRPSRGTAVLLKRSKKMNIINQYRDSL